MKNLILTTALVFFLLSAQAKGFDKKDLLEGEIAGSGECSYKQEKYQCVLVVTADKKFIVVLGEKEILAVYQVKEIKPQYEPGEAVIVWEKSGQI